jgi:threonine synthase
MIETNNVQEQLSVQENQEQLPIQLECIRCHSSFHWRSPRYLCSCQGLLEVKHKQPPPRDYLTTLNTRRSSQKTLDLSGVWRFREYVLPIADQHIVTHPEGNTRLYARSSLNSYAGLDNLFFKHEGENPTGSFKDRGMTVAVTMAKRIGAKGIVCASTGNTSAALAAYAAHAQIPSVVLLPAGKIALGKLSQAVAYGARCLAVRGDFDAAMRLVTQSSEKLGLYVVNSVNPFRLEGQKTIIWELLQQLNWQPPDWIVVPAGNLGNTSAFGKALLEAKEWGWIDRLPRIASIQAEGANPFYQSFQTNFEHTFSVKAETIATAIRIGNPVNFEKGVNTIRSTQGVVEHVTDAELLEAKMRIDGSGIGCEPASACTLAGIRKLVEKKIIGREESVVAILTGNILKDAEVILSSIESTRKAIKEIDPQADAVKEALDETSSL